MKKKRNAKDWQPSWKENTTTIKMIMKKRMKNIDKHLSKNKKKLKLLSNKMNEKLLTSMLENTDKQVEMKNWKN